MQLKKGQRISITNNSIFKMMGYQVVTGKVFTIKPDGRRGSILCDQTGAIEMLDLEDGLVEIEADNE